MIEKLQQSYATTPTKLKLIDAYLVYILLTGVIQFLYPVLVGTFPFNAFLSGFISTVASFVLAGMFVCVIFLCQCDGYLQAAIACRFYDVCFM